VKPRSHGYSVADEGRFPTACGRLWVYHGGVCRLCSHADGPGASVWELPGGNGGKRPGEDGWERGRAFWLLG
jgi:hypothetical protein